MSSWVFRAYLGVVCGLLAFTTAPFDSPHDGASADAVPGDSVVIGPVPGHAWAIPDTPWTETQPVRRKYPPPKPGLGADVRVLVRGTVKEDSGKGTWKYFYVVENLRGSPRGVMSFSLVPMPRVEHVSGPKGWTSDWSDSLLNWFCTDPGPPPKVDDGNIHPSPFDLQPGASATFSFISGYPPGDSVTYYVEGFHGWPVARTYQELDSIEQTQPPRFMDAVRGRALGPNTRH